MTDEASAEHNEESQFGTSSGRESMLILAVLTMGEALVGLLGDSPPDEQSRQTSRQKIALRLEPAINALLPLMADTAPISELLDALEEAKRAQEAKAGDAPASP